MKMNTSKVFLKFLCDFSISNPISCSIMLLKAVYCRFKIFLTGTTIELISTINVTRDVSPEGTYEVKYDATAVSSSFSSLDTNTSIYKSGVTLDTIHLTSNGKI